MLNFFLETAQPAGDNGLGGTITMLIMIAALVIIFFLQYRSNKKKEQQNAQMKDSLQVGDEVTTIGGIIGKVVSIKGETFVLETTKEKTKIRFLKAAISSVDVKAAEVAAQIIETKEAEAKAEAEAEAATFDAADFEPANEEKAE